MRRSCITLLLLVLLGGCPPTQKAPPATCTKVGENCEVSPGKLGTCVTKDGCTEASAACFVCQSQH